MKYRGRFAPSPTGLMHVGNARTALVAWLSIRQRAGAFIWRLEDLDTPRVVEGMAEAAVEDLRWLGIDWDEGPDAGGTFGSYAQSDRYDHYEMALSHLLAGQRIFPCTYSRKDLQSMASAPHAAGAAYPRSLRPVHLEESWFDLLTTSDHPYASIRFKVNPGEICFADGVQGVMRQNVLASVGDFVVKRRDGMYAYQLAVVVDDLAMHITEVVRGVDLLGSTGRQIQLIEALGGKAPHYAHVPLVLNHQEEKLSKRDDGLTLRAIRSAGIEPAQLAGYLAYSLGLIETLKKCQPRELIAGFSWKSLQKTSWILPADIIDRLKSIV